MNNIDAVIFDLDNTLYEETDYFFHVVELFCEKNNISIDKYMFYDFFERTRNKSKNIINDILGYLSVEINDKKKDELFDLLKSIETDIYIYKDAELFLEILKDKNIKLGLLTNGVVDIQKNKIKCLKIESIFNEIVFARKWGASYEKPHEKSFIYIVNQLEVNFENCLFIGDNPKLDFDVPLKYKSMTSRLLRGTYKNFESKTKIDFVINNYTELIKKLN